MLASSNEKYFLRNNIQRRHFKVETFSRARRAFNIFSFFVFLNIINTGSSGLYYLIEPKSQIQFANHNQVYCPDILQCQVAVNFIALFMALYLIVPFLVRFCDISGPFDLAKGILDRKYKETQLLGHRRLQKGTIRYINF